MPNIQLPIEMDPHDLARHELPLKPDWFEKKLKQIVGTNRFGELNIRVIFGQDPALLITAMGERRMKYRAATSSQFKETRIGEGLPYVWEDKFDIGIPLWFGEVWIPPEEFGSAFDWNQKMYKYINGVRIQVLDPFPSFGDYTKWLRFEHRTGRSYWGPNQRMLDVIEHGWRLMQEMKTVSVDDLIIADYKEAARRDEEDDNVLRPEFKEFAKDWTKLIQKDFTVDMNPKGVKHDGGSTSGAT